VSTPTIKLTIDQRAIEARPGALSPQPWERPEGTSLYSMNNNAAATPLRERRLAAGLSQEKLARFAEAAGLLDTYLAAEQKRSATRVRGLARAVDRL
jgi:hypothetical protein